MFMNTSEEIKYYVSQKSNTGALLVTGKWGCGKTYLICQIINELNNGNEYIAVLVSLFGVDSIELLHNEIKNKVFFSRGFDKVQEKSTRTISCVKDLSVLATEILGEAFPIAKSINKALNVRWQDYFNVGNEVKCFCAETENHIVKKKLVLFFDDFERSKLDRIELMGVINEYSENREIKVVLIADEDKITNKEKEKATSKDENTEDNEYKYSEFKEKLISRTVKIKTNYKSTIDSILNTYKETIKGYRKFLTDNRELIYCILAESETYNFRSVNAFITDYERVHEVLNGLNVSSKLESNLFYHFGAILFGFKSGFYQESEYGFLFSDIKVKELFSKWSSTYVLNSFQDWIVKGMWSKENLINEVNNKFNSQKLTVAEKFLNYSIWDLSQIDIEKGMPEVIKMAYEGKLNRDQLIKLLQKIHFLRDCSSSLPCDIDYSKIDKGFKFRKQKILKFEIQEPKRHTFSKKSEIDEEAYSLYDNIEELDKKLYVLENRRELLEFLKSDSIKNLYNFKRKLIGDFDAEMLDLFHQKYLKCDNSMKRDMCFMLLDISFCDNHYLNNDEVKETVKNLTELKNRIENCYQNKKDYITAAINKSFGNKINNKVTEIKEYHKLDE